MLQLKNIIKDYPAGDHTVRALRGVDLSFRKSEFVSVLGPSGCGKTTLLNIIGGLDRYTSGDLLIDRRSTGEFKDHDWDTYRNHSVGFVFQNYNLIPHQSVLSNVELAMTLSGVGKAERRKRARQALCDVGLEDQINKRPNQLSGGQMQRVAIARALVNDPEIILADEPTGALDTETSRQVMEILKKVSRDRLVIMVTHNSDLALDYSTRIIRLLDGKVTDDSDPYDGAEREPGERGGRKRPSMSFFTALSLSFNNLMTKKGRTLLTAFAGSIGIIGIALIMALSNGVQNYIDDVQKRTLSSYPITIYAEQTDVSGLLTAMSQVRTGGEAAHEKDAVYSDPVFFELMNAMINAESKTNNLKDFKLFLEDTENNGLSEYVSAVQYSYDVPLDIYSRDAEGNWQKSDILSLWEGMLGEGSAYAGMTGFYSNFSGFAAWRELLSGQNGEAVDASVRESYDLLYGSWPEKYDEVVVILNENNELTDLVLYCLGLESRENMNRIMASAMRQEEIEISRRRWSYEEICALPLRLILNADHYSYNESEGVWEDITSQQAIMDMLISNGLPLKICGVVRASGSDMGVSGGLGYTSLLTEYVINATNETEIVKAQTAEENENLDVFTGLPFTKQDEGEKTTSEKSEEFKAFLKNAADREKAGIYLDIFTDPDESFVESTVSQYMDNFKTREDILSFLSKSYAEAAGMSPETVSGYLEGYGDEELVDIMTEAMRQTVAANYKEEKTAEIRRRASMPSEEQLSVYADSLRAMVLAGTGKAEYIAARYMESTQMSAEAIGAWLASLSPERIDGIFDGMMRQSALEYYENSGTVTEEAINASISAMLDEYVAELDEKEISALYDEYMPTGVSQSTLKGNLELLGVCDLSSPSAVSIYTASFESKDRIADIIKGYNEGKDEQDRISYTDYVAMLMSSVTTIINAISYVLIAFVSISLVVSSIMIGIITYISVLERTKEIGLLRAVGASKRDIARVFNAETIAVGFFAGLIGIGVSLLLTVPINLIIRKVTGISNLGASLPLVGAVGLVLISMLLTFIAGLIPSRLAAKKDPVVALRTE